MSQRIYQADLPRNIFKRADLGRICTRVRRGCQATLVEKNSGWLPSSTPTLSSPRKATRSYFGSGSRDRTGDIQIMILTFHQLNYPTIKQKGPPQIFRRKPFFDFLFCYLIKKTSARDNIVHKTITNDSGTGNDTDDTSGRH